jgi:hypothetical protein
LRARKGAATQIALLLGAAAMRVLSVDVQGLECVCHEYAKRVACGLMTVQWHTFQDGHDGTFFCEQQSGWVGWTGEMTAVHTAIAKQHSSHPIKAQMCSTVS